MSSNATGNITAAPHEEEEAELDDHPDCYGIHRTADGYAGCDGRPI